MYSKPWTSHTIHKYSIRPNTILQMVHFLSCPSSDLPSLMQSPNSIHYWVLWNMRTLKHSQKHIHLSADELIENICLHDNNTFIMTEPKLISHAVWSPHSLSGIKHIKWLWTGCERHISVSALGKLQCYGSDGVMVVLLITGLPIICLQRKFKV